MLLVQPTQAPLYAPAPRGRCHGAIIYRASRQPPPPPTPKAAGRLPAQNRYYASPEITDRLYARPKLMDGTQVVSGQVSQQRCQLSSTPTISSVSGSETDVSDREYESQFHEMCSGQQSFRPLHRPGPMFIPVDVSFYADDYTQHYNNADHYAQPHYYQDAPQPYNNANHYAQPHYYYYQDGQHLDQVVVSL